MTLGLFLFLERFNGSLHGSRSPFLSSGRRPGTFFSNLHTVWLRNLDPLFEEAPDLVEAGDYDYELTSARLLGRDISKIASSTTNMRLCSRVVQNDAY